MFCPSCGVAAPESLSFCKFCGARVNRDTQQEASQLKPNLMLSAMVITFIFGLVANTLLLLVMKGSGFNEGQTMAFVGVGFLLMLILEAIFVLLLFRGLRADQQSRRSQSLPERATNELVAPRAEALPEPISSVTEHTTRAFAPLVTDRQTR